jgi:glucose dehydrogenase
MLLAVKRCSSAQCQQLLNGPVTREIISAGGNSTATQQGDYIVAYALPDQAR